MPARTDTVQKQRLPAEQPQSTGLPIAALLALATTGFLAIMTETLPAGLLPEMGGALHVSAALTGQLVTAYAAGSLLAAIPLTALTQGQRRRPLLLVCIGGFLVLNAVTAASSSYALTLGSRFLAGIVAGLAWGMIAGYARRLAAPPERGRAVAFAMAGTPLAFSLGVPAGTALAHALSWRLAFLAMSAAAAALAAWVLLRMPDLPGVRQGEQISTRAVLLLPGVRPVLAVVFLWMTAHNILYTYIAPFLSPAGLLPHLQLILFGFGVSAIAGIFLAGLLVDRMLRKLVLLSLALFAGVAVLLGSARALPWAVYLAVVIWGITFGGAATLLQTACSEAASRGNSAGAELAPSLVTTSWNLAIAGGSVLGGWLLHRASSASFPYAMDLLVLAALAAAWRFQGFPDHPLQ